MGSTDLLYLADLKKRGLLNNLQAVCDIGATQLYCENEEDAVLHFLKIFNANPLPNFDWVRKISKLGHAQEVWQACGIHYLAVDTSSEINCLQLDLNFDSVPKRELGRYELVLNFGTTEHVANQINAMKIIHDLAAPSGLMYHVVPFSGYQNHSLIKYNPKFFWSLCRSNDYEYLDLQMDFNDQADHLHEDIRNSMLLFRTDLFSIQNFRTYDGCIRVLMRKKHDKGFIPPFDGFYNNQPNAIPPQYSKMFQKMNLWNKLKSIFSK